jgi:3',5'-cyclic AMP phosphodiesterase CpdA
MKILHVADLHAEHDWFDWTASQAPLFDLLVIAGDLQNGFSNTPMHDQARAISKWLLTIRTPTVVCSGNHDYWTKSPRVAVDPDAEAAWLRRLAGLGSGLAVDGSTVSLGGLRIAVNGWAQIPVIETPIDILVTHAPPMGCACAGGAEGRDVGDPELWDALKFNAPRLMLCGHVHQPNKTWCRWPPPDDPTTLILVPGCDEEAKIPNHWIINTDKKIAMHSNGWKAVHFQ